MKFPNPFRRKKENRFLRMLVQQAEFTVRGMEALQQFVRQVHSGQGGGYYLQLDIHNFFNSISRATLYRKSKKLGIPLR